MEDGYEQFEIGTGQEFVHYHLQSSPGLKLVAAAAEIREHWFDAENSLHSVTLTGQDPTA